MPIHRVLGHTDFSAMSKAYLRYRQALRFSAAMQAAYAVEHPDPAPRQRPVHERALSQMLDLEMRLQGTHVDLLV